MMADSASRGPDDLSFTDADAVAYRADVSVGLGDFFDGRDGRVTFYVQNLDAGYSAPGQATIKDTEVYGGTFRMPVTKRLSLAAKGDQRTEDQGLKTRAIEVDVVYKLTDRWSVSGGVRNDLREDRSPIVPLTQEQGERTDAVAQVMFEPSASWRAYGFVQDTVASSGGREDNGRVGAGGSYRPTKRFKVDAEVSDGDLGVGGRVGTSYLYLRAHQSLPELCAGKRAGGRRPASPPGQPGVGLEDEALRQLQRLPRGALPGPRVADRSHARHRNPARATRTLEYRRQCGGRHVARFADRRRDRPQGDWSPPGLRRRKRRSGRVRSSIVGMTRNNST